MTARRWIAALAATFAVAALAGCDADAAKKPNLLVGVATSSSPSASTSPSPSASPSPSQSAVPTPTMDAVVPTTAVPPPALPTTTRPAPAKTTTKPPAPKTTAPAAPKTTAPPAGGPVGNVTPGAFCSPEGAIGYTSKGTMMRCTQKPGEKQPRWRAA
ncbi:hypothetical protein ACQP00_01475 [Dactylosporangium sp. CS-047395]|uniref:hypothetical protein n=1 Tax=Dactylosporangium sp. CS-047395 TaxID=3239936 RepID=UPI003D93EF87